MVKRLGTTDTYYTSWYLLCRASWSGAVVKNLLAREGAAGGIGSIPGQEDPLEEEATTHSSILAWEIPWTEVPGGLQSMGL